MPIGASLVAAALLAGTARAEEPAAEAEALIQKGVELRRAGKNGEALSEFQKAFALTPTPRAEAQIALALHALGDWLGAERALKEALRAADDPWIAQYRDPLEGALATVRAHLGWLSVSVNVAAGELLLNGVSVHAVPLSEPIRVAAGTLDVAVHATGYAPSERTTEIAAGAEQHEVFTLEPLPPPIRPPEVVRPVDATMLASTSAATRAPSLQRSLVGYATLGGAGVLVGGGIVAWRVRESDVATYNDNSQCLVGTRTRGQQCGHYADAANEALGLEIAAFAAAAGVTGLGAWLLLWRPPIQQPLGALSCSPWSHAGVMCGASF
jgi:tetratricopeptide (TPR) repeat protein